MRAQLLQFLEFQGDDGLIVDAIGFDGNLIRGTVETDQESSFVQAARRDRPSRRILTKPGCTSRGGTAVAIQAGLLEPEEVLQTFARMIRNKIDSGSGSVGVTLYPAYPAGFFQNTYWMGAEYFYQNGGDWPWFGARIIQQMVAHGQIELAYRELGPMLDRVLRDDGIHEWYTRDGQARGSAEYRGSAGQLALAIDMLLHWVPSAPQ